MRHYIKTLQNLFTLKAHALPFIDERPRYEGGRDRECDWTIRPRDPADSPATAIPTGE